MKPDRLVMPGQVWGLAATASSGPIFVTSYAGHDLDGTVLTAVDPADGVVWQRSFAGHPGPPRGTSSGTVWVAHAGGTFTEVGVDGSDLRSVVPEHEPHEHMGAFVVLPDGFCVIWLPGHPYRVVPPGRTARVARHTWAGGTVWSTPLVLAEFAFAGADAGWQAQPMEPWRPRTLGAGSREPLLVSGDRVLAEIADGSSGIGVCTLLDAATGRIVTTTPPGPYCHKAITGPGSFLIGRQGYGEFTTTSYDATGQALRTWAGHGMMLVDRHGTVRSAELENGSVSRSRFRVLNPDGSVSDGPLLSGYHTTAPALDVDGTAVFWRDGQLLAVDAERRIRTLFAEDDDRGVMSRILLLDHGQVVFALHDELFVVGGTGLARLDTGPWPCGDGNLGGNPVR
ncbi:hypothetical protein [Actinoplanes sp. NPDC026670]|uniref:hypothetical protein n=1 Tax=Actinoplanes sp. NPDC026670 TaxID=3154700 RepID=UPI0033ED7A43